MALLPPPKEFDHKYACAAHARPEQAHCTNSQPDGQHAKRRRGGHADGAHTRWCGPAQPWRRFQPCRHAAGAGTCREVALQNAPDSPAGSVFSSLTVPAASFVAGVANVQGAAGPAYGCAFAWPVASNALAGPTAIYVYAIDTAGDSADGLTSRCTSGSFEGGVAVLSGQAWSALYSTDDWADVGQQQLVGSIREFPRMRIAQFLEGWHQRHRSVCPFS